VRAESSGATGDGWARETWVFSKNNGIAEGFHKKMETLSRKAHGFRNFESYRLRVMFS
jgi:transposase